jgi:uncharacterized protein YndB with AHSA1/START domain
MNLITVMVLILLLSINIVSGGNQMSNDPSTQTAEKRNIVLIRVIDAPVEMVWKAWTDPEFVNRWWGPKGWTSPSCKIDFREGGKFVFHMRPPKDLDMPDHFTSGVYKKIVPLELIEFTQGLSDKDGNRIDPAILNMPPDFPEEIPSALTFKRIGNKTELTAIEYGWNAGQMADLSEAGLNECLDKMEAVLALK